MDIGAHSGGSRKSRQLCQLPMANAFFFLVSPGARSRNEEGSAHVALSIPLVWITRVALLSPHSKPRRLLCANDT